MGIQTNQNRENQSNSGNKEKPHQNQRNNQRNNNQQQQQRERRDSGRNEAQENKGGYRVSLKRAGSLQINFWQSSFYLES